MTDNVAAIAGAHVEWSAMIRPTLVESVHFAPHEDFFDPESLQVLDESPNRVHLVGWNYGPRPVQIFSEGFVDPQDIPPESAFMVPGVAVRIIIQVL